MAGLDSPSRPPRPRNHRESIIERPQDTSCAKQGQRSPSEFHQQRPAAPQPQPDLPASFSIASRLQQASARESAGSAAAPAVLAWPMPSQTPVWAERVCMSAAPCRQPARPPPNAPAHSPGHQKRRRAAIALIPTKEIAFRLRQLPRAMGGTSPQASSWGQSTGQLACAFKPRRDRADFTEHGKIRTEA